VPGRCAPASRTVPSTGDSSSRPGPSDGLQGRYIKEYKYYSVNVNIIDRRGRLFRVRAVINSYYDLHLTQALKGLVQVKTERIAGHQ